MLPLKQELEQRWLLKQFTDEKLFELYDQWWYAFYFWMDPTADSLHLGNFINFMNAIHLMRRGNICIPLVGGATGMIGDPGWRDSERSFLSEEALEHNLNSIKNQVWWIIENIKSVTWENLSVANIVNNKDFYSDMSFLDFLRQVGKYITVNNMMTKETVKKRIEDPEQSISFTEFSYMLIQGYDFVRLYEDREWHYKNTKWCKLQIAWSDQRWNITTWTELIRKKLDWEAYAFTCPLVLDSNGKKFWKSEWNAIWLDSKKNPPTFVYQYFVNCTDADVERFLKLLTLLPFEEIDAIVQEHNKDMSARYGQKQLAYRVVEIIFWTRAADIAKMTTEILFGWNIANDLLSLNEQDFSEVAYNIWMIECDSGINIVDLIVLAWLTDSRWDAKKLIQQWGISLNQEPVNELTLEVGGVFVHGCALLQKGKKVSKLVRLK